MGIIAARMSRPRDPSRVSLGLCLALTLLVPGIQACAARGGTPPTLPPAADAERKPAALGEDAPGALEPQPPPPAGSAEMPPTAEAETAENAQAMALSRRTACATAPNEALVLVDDTQALLAETSCRAALWIDGLFGDRDDLDAAKRTHGYLETSVRHSEFDGTDLRTRLRVKFELPNVKERLSAFVGREDEEDFVRGRSEGFALRSQFPRVDDEEEWLAGLGYSLPDSKRLRANVRVGAASLSKPRVFVQGRLHYTLYSDPDDVVYARATPFWNSRIGFGLTTGLDYSHVLTPTLLARWTGVGTVSEKTEGFNWLSAVILYQNLREQRAIAYEGFVRGETRAPEPLYEFGARAIYRHPLVTDRLYGEFIVGYSFPRTDPDAAREGSYEVGFGLELPFGQNRE